MFIAPPSLEQPPKGVAQLTASTASRAAGGSADQKSRKGHKSVNDISNLNSSWAPQSWDVKILGWNTKTSHQT